MSWPIIGNTFSLVIIGLGLLLMACGEADDGCVQSEYELERGRYRCTDEGEFQTLTCSKWETIMVCETPEACSPGPDFGCRLNGYVPAWDQEP